MNERRDPSLAALTGVVSSSISRRAWLRVAANGSALAVVGAVLGCGKSDADAAVQAATPPTDSASGRTVASLTVHKSPSCGCCQKWVEYMRAQGHTVTVHDMNDVTPIKREHGVPESLYSCHTAIADSYVFEGHVPSDLVVKVLEERPAIAGLSAPGMPQSAPGMDIGNEPYDIKSFTRDGQIAHHATR